MASSSSAPRPEMADYSRLDSNPELWYECERGLLELMPPVNSKVYYFVQGHVEQASATQTVVDLNEIKDIPYRILCQLKSVDYFAHKHTDEVFISMNLAPLIPDNPIDGMDVAPAAPISKRMYLLYPANGSCRINLTWECAITFFPHVSYDEFVSCTDVQGNTWAFRLSVTNLRAEGPLLTTGWDEFVAAKRLKPGDIVILMRGGNGDLLIGIKRKGELSSVYLNAVSVLAAAKLAAERKPFTVYYFPRLRTPEFVVKADWVAAEEWTYWRERLRVSVRFVDGVTFQVRALIGVVSSVQALDGVRWPGSPWRRLQISVPQLIRASPWTVKCIDNHWEQHNPSGRRPQKTIQFELGGEKIVRDDHLL